MNKVFKSIWVALTLLALSSCQNIEMDMQIPEPAGPQSDLREVIITADISEGAQADDAATRTTLIFENGVPKTYWTPGDTIKIFSAGQSAKFTSINTEPSRKAKFVGLVSMIIGDDGESEKDYVWGLYPYRSDATYAEPDGEGHSSTAVITTTLPSGQIGMPGTFSSGLATMIGRSETLTISYKNAYSGVYIRFNRSDIVSVTLKGRHGENLAGRFTVGLDSSMNPEVKQVVSGQSQVTITDPVNGTFVPGQNYFLVTLPDVALQEGYSLTVRRSDGYEATFNSLTTVKSLDRNIFKTFNNPLDTYIENASNISSGRSTGWVKATVPAPADNQIWYTTVDGTSDLGFEGFGRTPESIVFDSANQVWVASFEGDFSDIPEEAFSGETNLKSIYFSDYLELIGACAFLDCVNLESVHFFDGTSNMCEIGTDAFFNCDLKSLELPDCMDYLGYAAFGHNLNLTTVKLPTNPDLYISGNPFMGCSSLASFTGDYPGIAYGQLVVSNNYYCSAAPAGGVTSIALSNSKTGIANAAFYGCKTLRTVYIPSSVTYVGYGAFSECTAMQDIYLNDHQVLPQTASSIIFYNIPSNCKIHITRAAYYDLLQNPTGKEGWVALKDHFVLPDGDYIELNSNSDYINAYWNNSYGYAPLNVLVPSQNDEDSHHAQIISDLNALFQTNSAGKVNIDNLNSMSYHFRKEEMESITSIGSLNVRFLVDDPTLLSQYHMSFENSREVSVLFAEIRSAGGTVLPGYEMQPVAMIFNAFSDTGVDLLIKEITGERPTSTIYNTLIWCKQDWVSILGLDTTPVADELLNSKAMTAFIGADAYLEGDSVPYPVKFIDGNDDQFKVNLIRPVNYATTSAKSFKDTDFGTTGTYISSVDILNMTDWMNRKFSSYPNYWNYYGSFNITFDTANAQIEINGTRQSFPVNKRLIHVKPSDPATAINGIPYYVVTNPFTGISVRIPYNETGYLMYCNNGTTLSSANIYVKASISYGFGVMSTDWIKIPVTN